MYQYLSCSKNNVTKKKKRDRKEILYTDGCWREQIDLIFLLFLGTSTPNSVSTIEMVPGCSLLTIEPKSETEQCIIVSFYQAFAHLMQCYYNLKEVGAGL